MYLYKCWQEFFSVDEQQHRTSVTRTREGEDEHTETPETVASGGAGLGKGDTGKKGKGKGKGKTKSKGKPTPSGAPKPKKEKTQDQLARNVPRLSCFFFYVASICDILSLQCQGICLFLEIQLSWLCLVDVFSASYLTGIWSRDFVICACYPAKALTKANANLLEISQWNYRLVKAGTCLGSSCLCWLAHRGSKSSCLYIIFILYTNILYIYIIIVSISILYYII